MCGDCAVMKAYLKEFKERNEAEHLLKVFMKDFEEGISAFDLEWLYKKAKELFYGEEDT